MHSRTLQWRPQDEYKYLSSLQVRRFALLLASLKRPAEISVQSSQENVEDGRAHALACKPSEFSIFDKVQMFRPPLEIVHKPGSFSV